MQWKAGLELEGVTAIPNGNAAGQHRLCSCLPSSGLVSMEDETHLQDKSKLSLPIQPLAPSLFLQ